MSASLGNSTGAKSRYSYCYSKSYFSQNTFIDSSIRFLIYCLLNVYLRGEDYCFLEECLGGFFWLFAEIQS